LLNKRLKEVISIAVAVNGFISVGGGVLFQTAVHASADNPNMQPNIQAAQQLFARYYSEMNKYGGWNGKTPGRIDDIFYIGCNTRHMVTMSSEDLGFLLDAFGVSGITDLLSNPGAYLPPATPNYPAPNYIPPSPSLQPKPLSPSQSVNPTPSNSGREYIKPTALLLSDSVINNRELLKLPKDAQKDMPIFDDIKRAGLDPSQPVHVFEFICRNAEKRANSGTSTLGKYCDWFNNAFRSEGNKLKKSLGAEMYNAFIGSLVDFFAKAGSQLEFYLKTNGFKTGPYWNYINDSEGRIKLAPQEGLINRYGWYSLEKLAKAYMQGWADPRKI